MPAARCYNRGMWKACLCRLATAATFSCLLLVASDFSQLSRVRSVYIWPMYDSFDQYLAEQIAEEDVFEVVVDPKLASAVLTDRIDAPLSGGAGRVFSPCKNPTKPRRKKNQRRQTASKPVFQAAAARQSGPEPSQGDALSRRCHLAARAVVHLPQGVSAQPEQTPRPSARRPS